MAIMRTKVMALAICLTKILPGLTPLPSPSSFLPNCSNRELASLAVRPSSISALSSSATCFHFRQWAGWLNGWLDCPETCSSRAGFCCFPMALPDHRRAGREDGENNEAEECNMNESLALSEGWRIKNSQWALLHTCGGGDAMAYMYVRGAASWVEQNSQSTDDKKACLLGSKNALGADP